MNELLVHPEIERVLLRQNEIEDRIDRVSADIAEAYRPHSFTVVPVLTGSFVFASDLVRRIPLPLELSFVWARSYRDGRSPGELELGAFPTAAEIEGRSVLLVDDILDTGRTLSSLREELLERGAADVKTCVFLDKPSRRQVEIEPDFRCFEIEDVFVVGYGLDFGGRYRNLPVVAALRPQGDAAGG